MVWLCLLPAAAALNGFQLHGDPECDNGLTFENVQLTCGSAYQGYSYGYNNNRGYGNGYRYNGGYNNGGQYANSYKNNQNSNQASEYMGKYYSSSSNSNGNQYSQQQQQQEGPDEQYYMNNVNGQVAGWTPEGSSTCIAGDTAYITGTLSIPESGLYGYDMKNRVCLYGQDWGWLTCKEFDVEGASFCSMFGLMAYGCPETGQFQITTSFNLPAQGEGYDLAGGGKSEWRDGFPGRDSMSLSNVPSLLLNAVSGWYSYIYTTLNTTDGFIYTCKTRIDTVNPNSNSNSNSAASSSYSAANQWDSWKTTTSNWYSKATSGHSSSSYALFGLSIVGVMGLFTTSFMRRRRLRAQIDLTQDEGATGDFEMMGDGVVRV